jgi:hypothetical protein
MSNTLSRVINEILQGEEPLGMGAAARRLPAHRGKRSSATPSCVWRWVVQGHRTRDGRIVKLEAARFAGRWITSVPALARFAASITAASLPSASTTSEATNSGTRVNRERIEAANKKLAAAGA